MPEQKTQLIEMLTGVYASKRSYYAELKEKIREITKRNSQLKIQNELARQISINTPLNQIIQDVSTRVREIIPFDRVSMLTFSDGKLYLNCYAPCEERGDYSSVEIPRSRGQALWFVSQNRKQLVWERGWGIEDLHLESLGMEVAVISPLLGQNKVFGLFVVSSAKSISYDPTDLVFLQQLANQLVIYLQDRELFAEVTRSKLEWEATFKAVRDPIVLVDEKMRVFRVNQAAMQFCGLTEREIMGKSCCEIVCFSKEPCAECAVATALKTGEATSSQHCLSDGRVMELDAYPSSWQEGNLGAVVYVKDISESLKMQVQLLKAARLAALGEMAAGVAHELNTPLAVIIGDAQLLLRYANENHKHRKIFEDIQSCGLRCKQIVQGLLSFSRQEQFVFNPLSINEVVKTALNLVSYQIETNNIKLDVRLEGGLPLIEGNAQQLEQVIVNLLLNAGQSFEGTEGKRLIGVATGFDQERHQVFIKVSDTGQGIKQENLPQIFDPFFTSKTVGKGTGLGLSVSLGIIQTHGGTISVESKVGEGSIFTVFLPPTQGNDDEESK